LRAVYPVHLEAAAPAGRVDYPAWVHLVTSAFVLEVELVELEIVARTTCTRRLPVG